MGAVSANGTKGMTMRVSTLKEFATKRNVAVALIVLAVAIITIALRTLGGMEKLELTAYDWCMSVRPERTTVPRVALIGIKEEDITSVGAWPLPDS